MEPIAPKKRDGRYWRNLLVVTLVELLIGALLVAYVVLPILYANGVAHPKRASVCCATPADHGLAYEDMSFKTRDGLTLRGWYIPSKNKAAVLVAHGIGGNRASPLAQVAALGRHGYGVLLFDLRAHGDSEGNTITFSGEDVSAAATFLQHRADVNPDQIGAMGISLGGLVVIQSAASTNDIKAIVADGGGLAAFEDEPRPATVAHWLDLPFQWVTFRVWERQGVSAPASVVKALPRIAPRPVLLIAGTQSKFEQGMMRKFYAAAGQPKTLWEIPEAGHIGGWAARPEEYEKRIATFFDHALQRVNVSN